MASLDSRKVERALKKKGFIEEAGDHKYFRLYVDGKDTGIFTKMSRNNQDVGDGLIKKMANQLKMEPSFFKAFTDCTKTNNDYLEELFKQNIL